MSAFGRIRSWPRVYGTTQKLQYSLQPSMIVTHARTGSLARVTPNGNATSSWAPRSIWTLAGRGGLLDQHRQHPDAPRADDDVDQAGALQQRRALLLRDAPGDRHDRIVPGLAPELAQLAEARVELLLGVLAHAARVDDDDVGVAVVGGALVAADSSSPAICSESW